MDNNDIYSILVTSLRSRKAGRQIILATHDSNIVVNGDAESIGVCTFDTEYLLLSMEEKPLKPKSNYAVPPFYIYKKENLHFIKEGLEDGCGIDAPGYFLEWFCKHSKCYVFIMPGKRYNIGSLNDYNKINKCF